ncbi:hypothetical protein HYH02_009625 [Chlamydomonas schloesseri]|uniref:Uncharacterized protein n=1 Tax=Chlamydomonas schloesseri TaxID=2026947 RepID=A0A835W698_9CHLO|nr:hypothetical protein HYH02_009625 [Chlamydomonas schloesseri]|eukprot:KAG2442137.1 hypothetical protein HYH02_009625 [Chlamydomonas schloesseri]
MLAGPSGRDVAAPFSTGAAGRAQGVSALRLPWSLSHAPRSLFGAAKPVVNPQIHTHDKYKQDNPQPANSFLLGRFVTDRNGIIWHRQANYRHARHAKSASQLTRLKRWKPLAPAFAAKLRKLGFAERYWAQPDPQDVPGFHNPRGRVERPRRSAVPDLDPTTGEPALRQKWQPPNRQRLR